VEAMPLYEIDRNRNIGLLTVLFLPPLSPTASFESFQEVIAHLRAPEGCPWDREQNHLSLRPYLLEETYEVLAALDAEDTSALKEELGDLLLQIVLHTQIATENGEFRMADVLEYVNHKLVYRHPHVFGGLEVDGVDHVLANWEQLKAEERKNNGKDKASILDGVPAALPALIQADQYQKRAARTGFEWPEIQNVVEKIVEEISEVQQAGSDEERSAEVGDLLFAVVNLARSYQIEPESALRAANHRFRRRFEYIEHKVRDSGLVFSDLTLAQMLEFWQQAKRDQAQP
jgi:tetrapyrrole methylase family protein / MazG family protein